MLDDDGQLTVLYEIDKSIPVGAVLCIRVLFLEFLLRITNLKQASLHHSLTFIHLSIEILFIGDAAPAYEQ